MYYIWLVPIADLVTMCNNDVLTYIFIIMFFYVLLTRLQIVDLLSGTAGSVPDKVNNTEYQAMCKHAIPVGNTKVPSYLR